MGFLSDLKRLFWAKKAVAKSAADKAGDEIDEATSEGFEKVRDFSQRASEKASGTFDSAKEYASRLSDEIWEERDEAGKKADEFTKKAREKGGETFEKAKKEGREFMDKAVKASDKFWEKAEDVGEDVVEKSKDLAGKAKEYADKAREKISEKVDEMLEKAEELDKTIKEEEDAIDANKDGFADTPVSEKMRQSRSGFEDKDDFWSRAEKYSEGDYSMGQPRITRHDEENEEKPSQPLKGFDDMDGDGDEIVDDAIIVTDDEDSAPASPETTDEQE